MRRDVLTPAKHQFAHFRQAPPSVDIVLIRSRYSRCLPFQKSPRYDLRNGSEQEAEAETETKIECHDDDETAGLTLSVYRRSALPSSSTFHESPFTSMKLSR